MKVWGVFTNMTRREVEIAAHASDLDRIRAQTMSTDDVEVLRAELVVEFEGVHREQVADLEGQIAKAREMYTSLQHEFEIVKGERDHQAKHGDAFESELEKLRQAEVDELKSRVEVLTLQCENPAVGDSSSPISRIVLFCRFSCFLFVSVFFAQTLCHIFAQTLYHSESLIPRARMRAKVCLQLKWGRQGTCQRPHVFGATR
jgi:archaellum component FlaC